ncbi:MAG: NAD/nadp octopine/nopaline dehydrogenase [Sphingobacterium sp.]|jgi:opine dehydrogenase|nr:NAD/nadp octopine/nopaline dehydrogenase [Sphingobacterium sp.]
MKITILGAGNSGFAAAIYFLKCGHEVLVYTRNKHKEESVKANPIQVSNYIEGSFTVAITSDLQEALQFGELLIVATLANAHRSIFRAIRGKLNEGQKLLILNSNWGAYEAAGILKEEIDQKKLIVGETSSQPFLATLSGYNQLEIKAIKMEISLAGLTEAQTQILQSDLAPYFDRVLPLEDVIATTLSSANPIIHVPLSLFHITRIENAEDYLFLGQSSPRALHFVEQIDKERIKIGQALHIYCRPILEEINSFWTDKYDSLFDVFHNNRMYCENLGPKSLTHRFLTEDLPFGIIPINSLGKLLHVDTPYSQAVEDMMKLYLDQDFHSEAVTFDLDLLRSLVGK